MKAGWLLTVAGVNWTTPRAGPLLNRLAGVNPEWALAAMVIRETRLVRKEEI